MHKGEMMTIVLGFIPIIGFLGSNWLQLKELLSRDKSNRKAINDIGKRVVRIEDHLISTDDFSREVEQNFVDTDY